LRCVAGFRFWVWMKLGKRIGSLATTLTFIPVSSGYTQFSKIKTPTFLYDRIWIYPPIRPYVRQSVYPSIGPPVRPSIRPSVYPSVRPCVRLAVRLSAHPSVYPPARPSIYLFHSTVRTSFHQFVHASTRPPIRPSTNPFFHESIYSFVYVFKHSFVHSFIHLYCTREFAESGGS